LRIQFQNSKLLEFLELSFQNSEGPKFGAWQILEIQEEAWKHVNFSGL
jgi:hypothetical protein